MARRKFVAGNWKMFTTVQSAVDLATAIVAGVGNESRVEVAVFPPLIWLTEVANVLKGTPVSVGAQNVYFETEGAYTGEVSPVMLKDAGCKYVIVGHSERRHVLGEPDGLLNRKVHAALSAGLHVIYCVGETLAEREANHTEAVLHRQLTFGFYRIATPALANVTIAYEPVWAIGTGRVATPKQAQDAHLFIRHQISGMFSPTAAEEITIQYGGSVKPENAHELIMQPDVDGALVGGASLKASSFLGIVQAAL